MATETGMKTYNHDIAGLYVRINRFIEELAKSASSNVNQMSTFDQARLVSYIAAIRKYQAWVMAAPQLDLPETHPRGIDLPAPPVLPEIENEAVQDLIRLFIISRDELVGSQSSRNAAGLISFDNTRFTAIIDKAEKFLTEYVQAATPLDLPESSPNAPMTGAGKQGV